MMEHHPLFTQKHYEYLVEELRKEGADEKIISVLIRILKRDNEKFRKSLFRNLIKGK